MPFFTQVAKPHPAGVSASSARVPDGRRVKSSARWRCASRRAASVPVELRSVPVLDPRRGDTVYRTTITDITERLRVEPGAARKRGALSRSGRAFAGRHFHRRARARSSSRTARRSGSAAWSDAEALVGRRTDRLGASSVSRGARVRSCQALPRHAQTPSMEARIRAARRHGRGVSKWSASTFRHDGEPAVLRGRARHLAAQSRPSGRCSTISERERSGFGRDLHDSLCQSLMGVAWLAEALRNDLREIDPDGRDGGESNRAGRAASASRRRAPWRAGCAR